MIPRGTSRVKPRQLGNPPAGRACQEDGRHKPSSVSRLGRRAGSSVWDPDRSGPQAAYPGLERDGPSLVPYLALLRMGFAMRPLLPAARCALTAPFHPCLCPVGRAIGGLLSAALSVTSRCPGVTRHPALWSSDFPPRGESGGFPAATPRPVPLDMGKIVARPVCGQSHAVDVPRRACRGRARPPCPDGRAMDSFAELMFPRNG